MTRKTYLSILAVFLFGVPTGCFKAPRELQTAIQIQRDEIAKIKAFYNDAINKLFDEIQELQLSHTDQFERAMVAKFKFKRGEMNTNIQDPNDDLNVIEVSMQDRIHAFAKVRREKVRQNIAKMRREYLKLNQSIDNVDRINQDIGTYVDSLIQYKKAQDALGQALLKKANAIVPGAVPAVSAVGELLKTFEQEFTAAAQPPPSPTP